jgi:hypothetical protein
MTSAVPLLAAVVLAAASIGRSSTLLGRGSVEFSTAPSSSASQHQSQLQLQSQRQRQRLQDSMLLRDLLRPRQTKLPSDSQDQQEQPTAAALATATAHDSPRGGGGSTTSSNGIAAAAAAAEVARQEEEGTAAATTTTTTTTMTKSNSESMPTASKSTTLALLYPPGLQGGYRNQVLRMVALCQHALQNNRTLFLPSLWWSTQRTKRGTAPTAREGAHPSSIASSNEPADTNRDALTEAAVWYPVPMDLMFDIDHWNQYATENPESLPLLVDQLPPPPSNNNDNVNANRVGDCWSIPEQPREPMAEGADYLQRELERRGRLVPVENWTRALVRWPPSSSWDEGGDPPPVGYNPRRHDLLPLVQHCTRPFVHGGGKMAGRLWNEYLALTKESSPSKKGINNSNNNNGRRGVYESVLIALRPRREWRQLGIEHCLSTIQPPSTTTTTTTQESRDYAVVHARIEPEMMAHPCGLRMERNLTVILDHVAHLLKNQSIVGSTPPPSVVVAVSREGLVDPRFPRFQELSHYNLHTLNEYTAGSEVEVEDEGQDEGRRDRQPTMTKRKLLHDRFPVVECGGEMMARYYRARRGIDGNGSHSNVDDSFNNDDTYGTLLEQVINFDVAVNAKVFVGVQGSSYSNAIWTTRHLLLNHKGSSANYRYTTSGIEPVVGMPPPHSNCPRGSSDATAAATGRRKRAP